MELFHFDIECAGNYKDFQSFKENDDRGYALFEGKYKKMMTNSWKDKYTSVDEAYLDNASIISTYGRIVCISCGYLHEGEKRVTSFYGDDEKDIVNKFNEALKKIETKNFSLCGFRIVNFDIPWVVHKLHKYGIRPANIIYLYNKKPWDLRVVDLSEDWKQRFAWAYSFDEMLYELGVDSPKDAMNGSQVHEYYWAGRVEEIKTYCEKDVKSSIDASLKIY